LASNAVVVPLRGNLWLDGYYFMDVRVGTPPQPLSLALDLAGSGAAVPCEPCGTCEEDRSFHVERSSSAESQPCGDSCSGTCDGRRCADEWPVGPGGRGILGHRYKDRAGMAAEGGSDGGADAPPAANLSFGCLSRAPSRDATGLADGVVGLGPHNRVLDDLFGLPPYARGGHFFSVCLAAQGGRLTVDGLNASGQPRQYDDVHLAASSDGRGYQVNITSLQVGGQRVGEGAAVAEISSASQYTYLPSQWYRALTIAVEEDCARSGSCGSRRGACWSLPDGADSLQHFPSIEFRFNGSNASFVWEADSYLFQWGRTSSWCYAFDDAGEGHAAVLGASWMLDREMVFDLWQETLAIAPANCSAPTSSGEASAPASTGAPSSTAPGGGREAEMADEAERLSDVVGARVPRGNPLWLVSASMGALTLAAAFAVVQGRALLISAGGQRRVQLREGLMDEVLTGHGRRASGEQLEGAGDAGAADPVELAERGQEAAEEEQE